jgi:UDP-glucose 4-epimerase
MEQSRTNSKRVVAVTGASGQLGRLILRRLIDDDEIERVLALDLVEPPIRAKKIQWVNTDIRDLDLAEKLAGVHTLMHLAFVVTKYLPRDEYDDINIEGSKNVFCAAATANIGQVLYASSLAAYGVSLGHPELLREDCPRIHVPEFPYSAAKFEVEAYLDSFEKSHQDMKIVRLRPSILVGVHLNNPLAQLFGKALARGYIVGAHDIPMPVVWDEDVADAFILAMKKSAHGAFNLSAEPLATPTEIAADLGIKVLSPSKRLQVFLEKLGELRVRLGAKDAVDPAWGKYSDIPLAQSCEKARSELGWTPKYKSSTDVIHHYLEASGAYLSQETRLGVRLRRIFSKFTAKKVAL